MCASVEHQYVLKQICQAVTIFIKVLETQASLLVSIILPEMLNKNVGSLSNLYNLQSQGMTAVTFNHTNLVHGAVKLQQGKLQCGLYPPRPLGNYS